jgi:hypothetical protein
MKHHDFMLVVPASVGGGPCVFEEPRHVFLQRNPAGLSEEQRRAILELGLPRVYKVCRLFVGLGSATEPREAYFCLLL